MKFIPSSFRTRFNVENIPIDCKVAIPSKYMTEGGKRLVSGGNSQCSRQKRVKLTSQTNAIVFVSNSTSSVGSGRASKYIKQENFIISEVEKAWKTGNALSRPEIYLLLIQRYGKGNEETVYYAEN